MTEGEEFFLMLAEGLDQMRESLSAMVAAIEQEGFSNQQAKMIVTGILGRVSQQETPDNEGEKR